MCIFQVSSWGVETRWDCGSWNVPTGDNFLQWYCRLYCFILSEHTYAGETNIYFSFLSEANTNQRGCLSPLNVAFNSPSVLCVFHYQKLHNTSNDRPFGCPVIYTDIYSQNYFVHWHLQQFLIRSSLLLIGTPYFSIIASNGKEDNNTRSNCFLLGSGLGRLEPFWIPGPNFGVFPTAITYNLTCIWAISIGFRILMFRVPSSLDSS